MIQEKFKSLGVGWAELLGIVTSFLFITGISYYYGYYDAGLNANWIINLLTTKELLISNVRLGVCVILAFMFLESIFDKNSKNFNVQAAVLIGVLFFVVLLIYSIYENGVWTEILSYLIALISIYGLIFFKIYWKLVSVLLIIFVVPFLNGLTAYEKKVRSDLPELSLKNDKKKWYLFDTFSDQAIIIDSTKKSKNIKIVPVNELENIKVR